VRRRRFLSGGYSVAAMASEAGNGNGGRALLAAAERASCGNLAAALALAASEGETAIAETLLGVLLERFPADAPAATEEALGGAVEAARWPTVRYLADYLAHAAAGAPAPPRGPVVEEVIGELGGEARPCARPPGRATVGGGERRRVEFLHVEPGFPEGTFGGAGRPSPYFGLGAPACSLRTLQGRGDPVVAEPEIEVRVDAPPLPFGEAPRFVTLNAPSGRGHFTREDLGRAVAAAYGALAASEDCPAGEWSHSPAELDLVEVYPLEGRPRAYGLSVAAA
jgi:hypothetical protein